MSNTKNGLPPIKTEWRLIHKTLHDRRFTSVRLGRRVYDIEETQSGCRYMDYDNIRFVEQNKQSKSALGRRARQGERITWCNPHDTNTPPFMIDQHALLQEVNDAVIYLPVKKRTDATIEQPAAGEPAPADTGTGKSKKPAAKRSSRKLGGK